MWPFSPMFGEIVYEVNFVFICGKLGDQIQQWNKWWPIEVPNTKCRLPIANGKMVVGSCVNYKCSTITNEILIV